ncbi:MAG: RES family NAD+ phosphorylase [Planctomycetes bacterium]|nr:RES family NAD+ phosphorylase [Planctomycetota bacterium]
MLVWRLCHKRLVAEAFSGKGVYLYGSQWALPGSFVVCVAETLSLAVLEVLVHLDSEVFATSLVAISAEVPEDIEIQRVEFDALPDYWQRTPAPRELQKIGTVWVREGQTAVLSIPSAVVSAERNFLLNPRHPDFSRILINTPCPFSLDARFVNMPP